VVAPLRLAAVLVAHLQRNQQQQQVQQQKIQQTKKTA
jgi:hypothetical protein